MYYVRQLNKAKQAGIDIGVWLFMGLLLPCACLVLYAAAVLTLGRFKKVFDLANELSMVVIFYTIYRAMTYYCEYIIYGKGDTWLSE